MSSKMKQGTNANLRADKATSVLDEGSVKHAALARPIVSSALNSRNSNGTNKRLCNELAFDGALVNDVSAGKTLRVHVNTRKTASAGSAIDRQTDAMSPSFSSRFVSRSGSASSSSSSSTETASPSPLAIYLVERSSTPKAATAAPNNRADATKYNTAALSMC